MPVEILIFAAVLLGVVGGLFLERFRTYFEAVEQQKHIGLGDARAMARPRGDRQLPALPRSPAAQLQQVNGARFSQRRMISTAEEKIFQALEVIIHDLDLDWRVMAQVNLAEIVESTDPDALKAIGDQRVALLIVSAAQMPLAAVEHRAVGQIPDEEALRTAAKREALRRADIDHIEIRLNDPPETLCDAVGRLVERIAAVTSIPPTIATAQAASAIGDIADPQAAVPGPPA